MARFVRIGNIVLDPSRVKVARIEAGDSIQLRMLLRTPNESVQVQALTAAEASDWLDQLAECTGYQRIQQALLPVKRVRIAQALTSIKVKGRDEGPGLRVILNNERVTVPTDTLESAQAFLDELLQAMQGDAESASHMPPVPPAPVPPPAVTSTGWPTTAQVAAAANAEGAQGLDPDQDAPEADEVPWDEGLEEDNMDMDEDDAEDARPA